EVGRNLPHSETSGVAGTGIARSGSSRTEPLDVGASWSVFIRDDETRGSGTGLCTNAPGKLRGPARRKPRAIEFGRCARCARPVGKRVFGLQTSHRPDYGQRRGSQPTEKTEPRSR